MNSQRVADYFIVAGLPEKPVLLDDSANDSQLKPTSKNEPITDICVIIPNDGEECPPGYKPLLETPTGLIADLNHGSIRSPEVFICFRRGRDKSPLTDIGVLYEGSERVLAGCEVVYTTPYGRPANINNTSNRIYLTYRRAADTAGSDSLAVTDICIINTSKGEKAPHSFCKIDKNLNQAMMSSSIFLCYKKSMCKDYSIAYKPAVLSRYPQWDWQDFPLPQDSVAMFGLPMGAVLESWPEKAAQAKPVFATFVLTGLDGKKVYGAAVIFYERFQGADNLTPAQARALGLHLKKKRLVHANKAICLLAKRPFFSAFRMFLQFLHRQALTTEPTDIPIERLISHFMWEVPFPSPERPRIQAHFSENCIVEINLPDESPIPLSGASFSSMLRNLGVENTVSLLTMTLLEHKILIHSLRPAVLTGVIEAVGSMIFPFSWQCPYIPLCPLGITDVLFAPLPYIVGVDSRYFDLYDPPLDVTCVDLDTNTISKPSDNKLLPKRPTKVLKATLEKLYFQIHNNHQNSTPATDDKKVAAEDAVETLIQEAFLRFMASILKGYKNYLLPVVAAPSGSSTSVKDLFDLKGFVKSRDKAYHKLYDQMVRTQAFTRFIEERTFSIRDDTSLLFFDECTEHVDENYDVPKLLEIDPYKSGHTVFVSPPHPDDTLDPPPSYSYDSFPSKLDQSLFPQREQPPAYEHGEDTKIPLTETFIARRSKAEIKAALKLAAMSKKGIAASTLWSKCLVNNTFSLWFVHLSSFILASQSSHCALRAACAVLKKMQEYRLHTPDEMCFRTMMQLCGIYKLPVVAVKVLCEMRSIGVNANAVTYGYYNKAVLEGTWPSESSNAQMRWTRIRHLLSGVSQFKRAIRNKRHSVDVDSLSRGSEDSNNLDTNDHSILRKDDGASIAASDVGYNSMSQEDIQKYTAKANGPGRTTVTPVVNGVANDAFRAKVGSIVRRSVSRDDGDGHNVTGSHLDSSAGLLITARRIVRRVPLGASLNAGDHAAFIEAKRKRHKSAGDHLKSAYQLDAESDLGCTPLEHVDTGHVESSRLLNSDTLEPSSVSSSPRQSIMDLAAIAETTSLMTLDSNDNCQQNGNANTPSNKQCDALYDPLTAASTTVSQSSMTTENSNPMEASTDSLKKQTVVSDDPLGLFSAQSSEIKQSTPQFNEILEPYKTVNNSPSLTSMDIGNLFGRDSSPKKTLDKNEIFKQNGECRKYNLLQFSPEKEALQVFHSQQLRKSVSLDSRNSYKAAMKEDDCKSADAVFDGAHTEDFSNTKDQEDDGSKDSLDSTESATATPPPGELTKTPSSYKSWVTSSFKRTTNMALPRSLSKMKSMVYGEKSKPEPPNMSSHESLDSIGTTPKTVRRNDDMRSSLKKIKSVSSSMASKLYSNYNKLKHQVKEYQAPSTVSTPYKEEKTTDTRSNEDNISLLSSHSALGVPINSDDYLSTHDDGTKPFDTNISYAGISPSFISKYLPSSSQGEDDVDSAFASDSGPSDPILEVTMCSATLCQHCNVILYDEDIMAGWSAQDSDLNTVCRFCDRKQVPFLNINMKDLRITSKSGRQSVSTEESNLSTPTLTPRSEASASGAESIKLPYLSPLVLRKELELVLDREGDVALTRPEFVDKHAIVYWNMVWYFKRLSVPSHLPQLLFQSQTLNIENMHLKNPHPANMSLRLVWDNPKLHEKMVTPMYQLWNDAGVKSTVVRALLTEEKVKSRAFMQQILTYVECNDMYTPLKQILNNRRLELANSTVRCQSAYRDILFLSFAYFGRDIMDHDAFDREYKFAFKKLTLADKEHLEPGDFPPTPTVMWCRKLFGNLEVM